MTSLVIVVSAVLVLSCGQTHKHTYTHTDADERFTPATLVGVSNKIDARERERESSTLMKKEKD